MMDESVDDELLLDAQIDLAVTRYFVLHYILFVKCVNDWKFFSTAL